MKIEKLNPLKMLKVGRKEKYKCSGFHRRALYACMLVSQ
jgi:hypothetical protein